MFLITFQLFFFEARSLGLFLNLRLVLSGDSPVSSHFPWSWSYGSVQGGQLVTQVLGSVFPFSLSLPSFLPSFLKNV